MARTVLITGTSTGIGYGAAKAFAAAGYRVIGTVRKTEDAERLRRELGENLYPVLCDVTLADQVAVLPEHVENVSARSVHEAPQMARSSTGEYLPGPGPDARICPGY